jgi:integrase/recombinase XerD
MKNIEKYLHTKGYRLNTIRGIVSGIKKFLQWCEGKKINPVNVTYTDVVSYMQDVQLQTDNKRTLSGKIQAVRIYYNYLIRKSEIDINPVKDLQIRNKVKQAPKNILKFETLENIYKSCTGEGVAGKRNRVMVGLMIYQGLGTGELTALEVKDVNIHEGKIYVPQIGRSNSRTLKLEAHQVIEIQNYIKQSRPML